MKKIRIAVVGLGRIGWSFHIPEILKHEGFELAAVVDPLAERLNEAYQKYSVKGYTDYSELLENEKLDLVVLASPTPFHVEQTIKAFKKGIDVFLEKPMTPTLEEADYLIAEAKKSGRKLMVYQPHRCKSEMQVVKSLLAQDLIGPVYLIKRSETSYVRRNDWQTQKKYGGGMLNNYGAHYIDQLLNLTGSKAKSVSCKMFRVATLGDADDVVKAVIETENGVVLDLDINMATSFPFEEWVVCGTRGTIIKRRLDDGSQVFKVRYLKEEDMGSVELKTQFAAPGRTYRYHDRLNWSEMEVNVSDFAPIDIYEKCYAYYGLGEEPFVKLEETREVMRVIKECRKDAGWTE